MTVQHPLHKRLNACKDKLDAGKTVFGLFLLSGSSSVAECCAGLPYDWIIVDMEASPVTNNGVLHILQAMNGSLSTPFVRVPKPDKQIIEHMLDLGAQGILVPKVDNVEIARSVVDAAYFPPKGGRGINPVRASGYFNDIGGYLSKANNEISCMVQIESKTAVDNASEIAAVDGVHGLFIGCGDLSSSYGQAGNVTGEKMDKARAAVLEACRINNKVPGIFAYSLELAQDYVKEGFKFIAVGNDFKLIRERSLEVLNSFSGK